jgi:LPS sulfotransferase NodH
VQSYDDVLQHVAQPSKAPTTSSYAICATPRSGSTLLCECLSLTGVAGVPDEWLLRSNEALAKGSFPLETTFDDPGYLPEIIARSRTPNGVFGVKLMWPELDRLRSLTSGPQAVPNMRYIRMSRRDKIRQAISLCLAVRTNYWHKMRRDEHLPTQWPVEALAAELAVPDARSALLNDVRAHLGLIQQQEDAWDRFFTAERISPFAVEYEALVTGPVQMTRAILRFLGLEGPADLDFSRSWHLPMADERNEMLLSAYHRDRR